MTDRSRWEKAQKYEKSWWDNRKAVLDLNYFKTYSREVNEFMPPGTVTKTTAILEIGCGPAGTVTDLDSDDKHAIDPLVSFYSTVPEFVAARDPRTHYYTARGEELPFPDSRFDLVIMDNVLDHGQEPLQIIAEMKRVIKPGGQVYFRQHVYSFWGYAVRWLMERFVLDPGHPHTYTEASLRKTLKSFGFTIEREKHAGHLPIWWAELRSGNRKAIVRALMLVTRDKVTFALRAPR
ncbi:MAG: class I SAM-dependent methyltransferase [bacterium]|nr:class I SAM-dependent methyltransferase [bacterium]